MDAHRTALGLSDTDQAREARARRAAKRQGFRLNRSRWRLGSVDNLGGYQIVEDNMIVAGSKWDLDLDEVEEWLGLEAGICVPA